jgi:hypothetical protein
MFSDHRQPGSNVPRPTTPPPKFTASGLPCRCFRPVLTEFIIHGLHARDRAESGVLTSPFVACGRLVDPWWTRGEGAHALLAARVRPRTCAVTSA